MPSQPSYTSQTDNKKHSDTAAVSPPSIELPKGGGAIRSIGEKFSVNAINGTAGCNIPFPFSPSRNAFMPSMALSYSSGSGNSVFGLGWEASASAITRKTEKQLPLYRDEEESDIFTFSGAEDLVPVFIQDGSGTWARDIRVGADGTTTARYRPRIEGSFSRIERIREVNGNVYWKVTTGNNVVSVYGKSSTARIADPSDPAKVFSWLLEFSYDDKGNCWEIGYKQEDRTGVPIELHEQNRLNGLAGCANAYIKRFRYGNKTHFDRSAIRWDNWEDFLANIDFLLELVLDYGEHDQADPQPTEDMAWACRADPFSSYRAGFEIRYWRLCQRVLMFHRYAELGDRPCLVRSLDLGYITSPAFTFLNNAVQKGYIRKPDGTYSQKSLPPLTFEYAPLAWNTDIHSLPIDGAENLPTGIDEGAYQWIDLYNEGISGILTEQAGAWFYKSNAGEGNFDGTRLVASKPSLRGLSGGSLHFQDLDARGRQFLVQSDREGYYELDDDGQWLPFRNFHQLPRIDWKDPNLKMLDLNGDGMADILITEDELFTWHASRGKEGFDPYQTVQKALDEEKGPAIVFADSTQSIVLADINGDGLTDIVRIRYSEVCYWPNLGYGRFGAKVNMSNAPVLDTAEDFNPRYVRLADLDGSGTADIIYLGKDSFQVYFNQAGNSWSTVNLVNGLNPMSFPLIDDLSSVSVVDLLGRGTGCIAWSSPLPQTDGAHLRYIDLTGGVKPHLLTGYRNNMGGEVQFQYQPSSFYYLQDKKAGTPWVTRLPMIIHCVSQVVRLDQITKTRFTSQYSYHHGYFDHVEREFRGFGRVDQTDTENFQDFRKLSNPDGSIQIVDEGFHQPPILTRSWFHTGAFLDKEKVLNQFAHEYYQNAAIPERVLSDPPLPEGLTIDEWREALRTCKGMPLRSEVYSPDGSDQQAHPYTTSRNSCLVQMIQPRLTNKYAVFQVQVAETLAYSYERNPADPRIAHSMTLAVDSFGNVLQSATISYGRKTADPSLTAGEQTEQGRVHILASEKNFTGPIDTPADYLLPVGYGTADYELTGLNPASGSYFSLDEVRDGLSSAALLSFEATPTTGSTEKRLLSQAVVLFLKNDLSGPLDPGVIQSLALGYQSYKLALTPGLTDLIFGDKLTGDLLLGEGKYVHQQDANYWIPSGTQTLDPANFYQATAFTDQFGFTTQVQYDTTYHWYVRQTTDALGNTGTVTGFNFRALSPYLLTDINDNRAGVRIDELGMVTASFVMGKENENLGDLMDTNSTEASTADQPSGIIEYSLLNYHDNGQPNFSKATKNDTHWFDRQPGALVAAHTVYAYSDGGGQVILAKAQAEPGLALQENPDGSFAEVDTTPNLRWIGNGRTIMNNKGQPVKQYEPYFSVSPDFEDARDLVERGLSPLITYDSAGRAVRTDLPDGTFTKVLIQAWKQQSFDSNDTVLDSQWYRDRIIAPIPSVATPAEIDAAQKAGAHAGTPGEVHLDSLGRSFITFADNGAEGRYKTVTQFDIQGNILNITDAAGNPAIQTKYDMLGTPLYHLAIDSGERWTVNDSLGKPLRGWDSRDHLLRYEYDPLHRIVRLFMKQGGASEVNTEKILYGEGLPEAKTNNLRGIAYRHYDGAGISATSSIDFKGNSLQVTRQLLKDYRDLADWGMLGDADLEPTLFTRISRFDALNRPLQTTIPDGTILRPVYDETGALKEVHAAIRGGNETAFVKKIEHDARGLRQNIVYGNNTSVNYLYDPANLRLARLSTAGSSGSILFQDLRYTYDPVGNITTLRDEAQQTTFFNNSVADPSADYRYDAVYRLIRAGGREHIGQNAPPSASDASRMNQPEPGDGAAMRVYVENYTYDLLGNIRQIAHAAGDGSWTRTYNYPAIGNRMLSSSVGNTSENYSYDAHGNILTLSHLQGLTWDFKDRLQQVDLGGGGTAYYIYDGAGHRIRKVIERQGGIREQRIYLGEYELYQKIDGAGNITEETGTVHITDGSGRIAIAETKTVMDGIPSASPSTLIRYQYGNHLGSACLELDENSAILSYEEYYPYGATAYQAVGSNIRVAAKRYRYTGMERDEESGLEYHGARYYLPWLGRWLSADPIGIHGGMNLYEYAAGNPVMATDRSGHQPKTDYDRVNYDMDTNYDKTISMSELQSALNNSKLDLTEWSRHMIEHPGAYRVDSSVWRILWPFAYGISGPTALETNFTPESKDTLHMGYDLDGNITSWTKADDERAARRALHPSEKIAEDNKNFIRAVSSAVLPEVEGFYHVVHGIAHNDPAEVSQGGVQMLFGVLTRDAGGGPVRSKLPKAAAGDAAGPAAHSFGDLTRARATGEGVPAPKPIPQNIELNVNYVDNLPGRQGGNTTPFRPDPSKLPLYKRLYLSPQYSRFDVLVLKQTGDPELLVWSRHWHEFQHVGDFLDHPRFSYLATESFAPGHGVAQYLFERRGYMMEFGRPYYRWRDPFRSMSLRGKLYLSAETLSGAAALGYGLYRLLHWVL